jgi:DNA-binding XRE family transcriptional regulator
VGGRASYLGNVPTRPSQNNPDRVAQWERWRAMVGANIRELRLQQGMTQEALALTSGVTRNVLIDVEQGKRGLLYERLFDIAEALQVSVGALLEGSAGSG